MIRRLHKDRNPVIKAVLVLATGFCSATPAHAQSASPASQKTSTSAATPGQTGASTEELQKQVQNPVANLISAPFQNNIDFGNGPYDRTRNTLNIQPVVPFKLSESVMLFI